jgi:hypothetical protein
VAEAVPVSEGLDLSRFGLGLRWLFMGLETFAGRCKIGQTGSGDGVVASCHDLPNVTQPVMIISGRILSAGAAVLSAMAASKGIAGMSMRP